MWSHIFHAQLTVTEDEFWPCILIHRVGLPEETVSQLTKEDAVARLQRYWADGV
ncbi:hypothetical protein [Streptomyces acidiscabies]|uniref:hypothetical protein n=1 Tax=Streptomyces acidiscabies TaxID=42234 RepID=UPI0015C03271|nr:hypothetical protein [Streptomyces acidiscabies]